jgi:hypothetical protein
VESNGCGEKCREGAIKTELWGEEQGWCERRSPPQHQGRAGASIASGGIGKSSL